MRHAPRLPGMPGQTFYVVYGLALFTVVFMAWLALQPQAAPLPTGPVLPGFSAARAQAHVQAWPVLAAQGRQCESSPHAPFPCRRGWNGGVSLLSNHDRKTARAIPAPSVT